MLRRIREGSPRLKARIAGAVFSFAMLTAAFTQFFVHHKLSFAADLATGIIEVSGLILYVLLLYDIFRALNRKLCLLALSFNFVALILELLQFNPGGAMIGVGFHGLYCFLMGYLIFKSTFVLRFLAAPMVFAGLYWLTYLSPTLANYLYPYNLALSMLGEASVSLWLLVTGVNIQRWKEQAGAKKPPTPDAVRVAFSKP